MAHTCDTRLIRDKIKVLLIGVGGTGSLLATDLARLNLALDELNHLGGMEVTVIDGDTVSAANVGRQSFYPPDIGHPKSDVVVSRINACYGFNWRSITKSFTEQGVGNFDLVISCVDSAAARRTIAESFQENCPAYWLDMGNKAQVGQCVLGQPLPIGVADWDLRLPTVTELYPELLDASVVEDDAPSCSLAEALEKQGLFVNRAMAMFGLNMVEQLIRTGSISYSAVFTDLARSVTTTLPISITAWEAMGNYKCSAVGR
jgi:PRTRC genetic system ThiF family protein